MPAYVVRFDERKEMAGRVARQRRAAEVRVLRQELCGARVQIGEVAAAAAGDADLLADDTVVLDKTGLVAAATSRLAANRFAPSLLVEPSRP